MYIYICVYIYIHKLYIRVYIYIYTRFEIPIISIYIYIPFSDPASRIVRFAIPGVGCEDRIKAVHLPVMFHEATKIWWIHGILLGSKNRFMGSHGIYPLVNIQKTMEHHHFQWVNRLHMAIFNSYVSLPEGIS